MEAPTANKLGQFIEGQLAQGFITALIVLNAISLGLETNTGIVTLYGDILHKFDVFVLAIFCIEIGGKLL